MGDPQWQVDPGFPTECSGSLRILKELRAKLVPFQPLARTMNVGFLPPDSIGLMMIWS